MVAKRNDILTSGVIRMQTQQIEELGEVPMPDDNIEVHYENFEPTVVEDVEEEEDKE